MSSEATVSVVTCGQGSELYSAFGHSAFRVYDPLLKLDKIYNYGTFDFNKPNFYLNFAKGKLIYQLSTAHYGYFLQQFNYENRWVKTQELDLHDIDVQAVYDFLENNAKPENRSYQYDFFYDNCSTKIEEVIKAVLKDKVIFNNNHITSHKSHRDLIADYTADKFKWGKFGIDLALGSVIDKEASLAEYKFLPDYIYLGFNNATINFDGNIKPLVKADHKVLDERVSPQPFSILQPFIVFLVIALFFIWKTYQNYSSNKRTKWVDFILYFISGLIGIVVLLLWFATSHTATYKNLNFLWAFAPNLVVAVFMFNSVLPKWLANYNKLLLVLLAIQSILWILEVQVFNIAIIPIMAMLFIRYSYLIVKKR
ncbi:DUF4105 domain-containing protein [Lutibacter sp.]|uniref:lipoprotein N-acyltransferase Lnb domain-containing protein n=1 Tax=Lutibacter sp. TaxID=1925666 RepID=UPI003561D408